MIQGSALNPEPTSSYARFDFENNPSGFELALSFRCNTNPFARSPEIYHTKNFTYLNTYG